VRVALNGHLLPTGSGYRSAGVATYERELVKRLPLVAPQHEFVFFTPPGRSGKGFKPSRLPTSNPIARIVWEQAIQPWAVSRAQSDVLHCPVNIAPVIRTCPTVVTLHDLAFLRHPEMFPGAKARYLRSMVGRSVCRAELVITPSEATATDAMEYFGVDRHRIRVIPLGVDERFADRSPTEPPLGVPYVLYVGTLEPRKNVDTLVRALAVLRDRKYPHHLAIVGGHGWKFRGVREAIEECRLGDRVHITGYVNDLVPWYAHASLFVYPSVFEGFGLPPLEAMASGTPVVTTSAASIVEVTGDAAIHVPPGDVGALAEQMARIIESPSVAEQLRNAGMARASIFSWDGTAGQTVLAYESAMR
jgi:glycosyltransferase involved in cell wall biosynthesis